MTAAAKTVPVLGAVVLAAVGALFHRVTMPAREIDRYAAEIRTAADGIVRNTDVGAELSRTRELAGAVPRLAGAYLDRLDGGQR